MANQILADFKIESAVEYAVTILDNPSITDETCRALYYLISKG